MPMIQISIPAGSLSAEKKAEMIRKVTDAAVEAEGIPGVRAHTWVHITEVPDGGWGMGGTAVTLAMMQGALAAGQ